MVRCWSIDSGKLHERTDESFDTAPGQPKQELQGQGQLDTWVEITTEEAARWLVRNGEDAEELATDIANLEI